MITCQETRHGILAEVELERFDPAELWARLHPEEQADAADFGPRRRLHFSGGRVALRAALEAAGLPVSEPVVIGARGEPLLGSAVAASVSVTHGAGLACALVAAVDRTAVAVGVDVESMARARPGLEREVLTPRERASIDPEALAREVVVRFSIKEALYKALDPFLRRWISFQEVEVAPDPDGSATCRFALREGGGRFAADVAWRPTGGRVLSTVRVTRVP